MKEHTLMRNPTAAQNVAKHSSHQVPYKHMKESTLKRDHSVAQGVTRHLESQES